jgi:hypothetical protein
MVATDVAKRATKEPVAWFTLLGLAVWDLNDATGPQAVPNASLFLAVVAVLFAVAVALRHRSSIVLPSVPVTLIFGCLAVGVAMIPFRVDFAPEYVVSDVGTLLFFLLAMVLAATYLDDLTTERTVYWFVVVYSVIAVVAYVAATIDLRPGYWYGGRWDPPYYMLFGGLALLARYSGKAAGRLVASGLIVVMLGLALQSGNRTQFALGLLFIFLSWASSRPLLYGMLLGAVGFAFLRAVGVIHYDPFTDLFAETRFSLLESGVDDSLAGRFSELSDIWYHITTLDSPAQTLFGRGAGALWQPITRTRVLVDPGGNLYYLHIGFAHMTYRYGLIGLGLFLYWLWVAIANLKRLFDSTSTVGERFWVLGAFGFSLNFFLQNSLYDPPAVVAMAVMLVAARQRIRRDPLSGIGGPEASAPLRPRLVSEGTPISRGAQPARLLGSGTASSTRHTKKWRQYRE